MKQRVLNFDGEFVKLLRGNLPRDKQHVLNFDGEFVKLLRGNLPRDKQHVLNFDGEFVKLLRGNIPRDKLSSAITWNSIFTGYNNHPNRTCFITSRYQWECVLGKLNKNDVYGLFLQITTTAFVLVLPVYMLYRKGSKIWSFTSWILRN